MLIDIIEAPVRLWVDAFFWLFTWKTTKWNKRSYSKAKTTPIKQSSYTSFWNNSKNKSINYESISIHFINSEKARKNLNWLKTGWKKNYLMK